MIKLKSIFFIGLLVCALSNLQAKKKKDSLDVNVVLDSVKVDTAKAVKVILPPRKGVLLTDQAPLINELVEKYQQEAIKNCPNLIQGFRVQIFTCSGKDCIDKSNNYFNQFVIAFPSTPAYKLWDPPSHKIRVGDCRSMFEAEKIKTEIAKVFPGVFIVPDFIYTDYFSNCSDIE